MKDSLGDTPYAERYPEHPGFKEQTTSKAAAEQIEGRAPLLRLRVLNAIVASPMGLTADEAAAKIGETVLACRPRITELASMGEIERTGDVRPNISGINAAVWKRKLKRKLTAIQGTFDV